MTTYARKIAEAVRDAAVQLIKLYKDEHAYPGIETVLCDELIQVIEDLGLDAIIAGVPEPEPVEFTAVLLEYEGALQSEDEEEIAPARAALTAFLRPLLERAPQPQATEPKGLTDEQRTGTVEIKDGRVRSYTFEQTDIPDGSYWLYAALQPASAKQKITNEQIVSVQYAAEWLSRSEDIHNQKHAEQLRALLAKGE